MREDPNLILDNILLELESYDGSAEKGIKIIESNQKNLDRIEKALSQNKDLNLDTEKMSLIIEKQKEIINDLSNEKSQLLRTIEQIRSKEKVVNNYFKNIQSIFVDKDI